jgi:iron complex outermembrane receptor protein
LGNGLLGTTKGFEISPEYRPTEYWRLRGSYSYLMMQIHKAPGSLDIGTAAGIAGSSPRHEAVLQSSFDISKAFQLDLTYRYVSALTATTQGVPGYSTGDVRFGWRLPKHFDLSLVGRNLFQPNHPEFSDDPTGLVGIDRSFYAKLTWRE